MNVEEGTPSNASSSEDVSQTSSMKEWLFVFGVVSVAGIAGGYIVNDLSGAAQPDEVVLPNKAVLVLSTRAGYSHYHDRYYHNVPMVISFNGEWYNVFSNFLFINNLLH